MLTDVHTVLGSHWIFKNLQSVQKRNIINQQKLLYIQTTCSNGGKIFKYCRRTKGLSLKNKVKKVLSALIGYIEQATRYSFEISDRKPELSMSNHMALVVLHYGLSFFVALWFKAHGSGLN